MDIAQLAGIEGATNHLREAAYSCRDGLDRCLGIEALQRFEWAENRIAEFKLWASTTGVFAGAKASLDTRLALEVETKNLVRKLLMMLRDCVEQCLETPHGEEPWTPRSLF
jgi:hypothetical protein